MQTVISDTVLLLISISNSIVKRIVKRKTLVVN
jgi:hypothetical protein